MNTMLELYREFQTYKENRDNYTRPERRIIRKNFREKLNNNKN